MLKRIKNRATFSFYQFVSVFMRFKIVRFAGKSFRIHVSNAHELIRALTFRSKEPDTVEWIGHYASKSIDLIDIGANIGIYSLYFAKAAGAGSRVISFEPDSSSFTSLNLNIAMNRINNIDAYMLALSNQSQWVELSLSRYEAGAGAGSIEGDYIFNSSATSSLVKQKVMSVTGNAFFRELDLTNDVIVKIDVDGHEKEVVAGMLEFLNSRRVLSVLIEINSRSDDELRDICDLIKGCGFNLVGRGSWVQEWNEFTIANYLFSRTAEVRDLRGLQHFGNCG